MRSIRGLAAKVQEAREAAEPRRGVAGGSSSEKRRRQTEKDLEARRYVSGVSLLAFFLCLITGGALSVAFRSPIPFIGAFVVGVFLLFALKVANQWE
ncbi:MAG: hypothetical protein ACXVH0_06590, partial [Thermoanaerobaculia bacterium]